MNRLSARLDYFRATTQEPLFIARAAQGEFSDEKTEQSIPLYGYAHALKHSQSGAIYLFSPHTATMGNCVQISGSAITALMEAHTVPSFRTPTVLDVSGWKVTRVDVAIDCFNPELRPRHVYAALDRTKVKTRWREWREVANKDLDAGHTVYGGGVESDKRIRIYDKAAESGSDGIWTRYEMVFSGARAAEVWNSITLLSTDAEFLDFAVVLLRSVLDFPNWSEWQAVFGTTSKHEWVEIPRTETDTMKWLRRQVMPVFRDAYDKQGSWDFLDEFVKAIKGG